MPMTNNNNHTQFQDSWGGGGGGFQGAPLYETLYIHTSTTSDPTSAQWKAGQGTGDVAKITSSSNLEEEEAEGPGCSGVGLRFSRCSELTADSPSSHFDFVTSAADESLAPESDRLASETSSSTCLKVVGETHPRSGSLSSSKHTTDLSSSWSESSTSNPSHCQVSHFKSCVVILLLLAMFLS